MSAQAIVQRMLEDDDVGDFLDRNDDLGWHFFIRTNGIHSWAWDEHVKIEKSNILGPYATKEEAVEAARTNDLHGIYMSLIVAMVPKHTPDLKDREKKLNYLRRTKGWDLNRRYELVDRKF